jgi:hypothetical protein
MSGNKPFLHVSALTTAAGLMVSPSSGAVLGSVVINTIGSGGNVLTIYDGQSTSGRVIAVVDTTKNTASDLDYDIVAPSGLWYTLLTGVAADLTIMFQ